MGRVKKCRGAHGVVHEYESKGRGCPECKALGVAKRAAEGAGKTKRCKGASGEVHEYDAALRTCPECNKIRGQADRAAAREPNIGVMKTCRGGQGVVHEYDAKHRGCPECARMARDRWRADNPERHKEHSKCQNLRRRGWSFDMKDAARRAQSGGCYICQTQLQTLDQNLSSAEHADHCHASMVPRALLCKLCNVNKLGNYEKHIRAMGAVCPELDGYLDTDWVDYWRQLGFDLEQSGNKTS